jgi:Leucine-rich repeat (LRR) protein
MPEVASLHSRIPRLDGVQALAFCVNNLTTLSDKHFFVNVTQLEQLDLSVNGLENISAGVFDLMPNLTTLELLFNRLNLSRDMFGLMPNLEYLDLSFNVLRLWAGIFHSMPNLRYLILVNTSLQSVPAGVFSRMPRLTELDLESNPLGQHPDFPTTVKHILSNPSLLFVSFDNCSSSTEQLQSAFPNISGSQVQALTFDWNEINGPLNLTPFCHFKQLKSLNFSVNDIHSVVLHCALTLLELNLINNRMNRFPPSCNSNGASMFPKLEYLMISYNALKFLTPATILGGLRKRRFQILLSYSKNS